MLITSNFIFDPVINTKQILTNTCDEHLSKVPVLERTLNMKKRDLIMTFLNLLYSSADNLEDILGLTRDSDIQIAEDNVTRSIEEVVARVIQHGAEVNLLPNAAIDYGNPSEALRPSTIADTLRTKIRLQKEEITTNGELMAQVGLWLSERRYGESDFVADHVEAKRQRLSSRLSSVDNQLPMNLR